MKICFFDRQLRYKLGKCEKRLLFVVLFALIAAIQWRIICNSVVIYRVRVGRVDQYGCISTINTLLVIDEFDVRWTRNAVGRRHRTIGMECDCIYRIIIFPNGRKWSKKRRRWEAVRNEKPRWTHRKRRNKRKSINRIVKQRYIEHFSNRCKMNWTNIFRYYRIIEIDR